MLHITKHVAAEILGKRRATTAGEHVKPEIGVKKAKQAATKLGKYSHKGK